MAVFFNGAFTRGLRREAERRLRRDTIEKAHAHLGIHPFSSRALFSGLGTRRLLQGRSKTQALSEPLSQRVGTSKTNYSSPGNQSRSSVHRGTQTQKKSSPTSGTQPSGSTRPTGWSTSRTSGTSATRPTTARSFHNGQRQTGDNTFNPLTRRDSNPSYRLQRVTKSRTRFHSSVK